MIHFGVGSKHKARLRLCNPGSNFVFIFSGTSNDSWTGGSIVSQLSPDILVKIKHCFQVQLPFCYYVSLIIVSFFFLNHFDKGKCRIKYLSKTEVFK